MSEPLVALAWDTDFFGFEVARVDGAGLAAGGLPPLLREARSRGARLVYVFAQPGSDADRDAAAAGGVLVDRKVTYLAALPSADARLDDRIRVTEVMTPRLRSLALQSGEFSRFRLDPRLPRDAFERMYTLWLERSLSGEIAKQVLVFEDAGEQLGLLTLGLKNGRGDIGLLAVDASARGRGVASALIAAAFARAPGHGVRQLQVVTQGDNAPACRLYERWFTLETTEHVHHVWLH